MPPRPLQYARRFRAAAPLALLLLAACAPSKPARTSRPQESAASVAARNDQEVRTLLLLMADQKRYEPVALDAFLDSQPALREELAVAVGRIGDARGRGILQGLLIDGEVAVRRAAAFALGELGIGEAKGSLIRAAVDDDGETGALAVEALGKIKAPLAEVRRALTALDSAEGERRLAPFLFRFPGDGMVAAAGEMLGSAAPEVRLGAAYALGRVAPPEGADLLRNLTTAPEARIRGLAARGLGEVGGPADLAALQPLLDDADGSPRIQALRAGAKILTRVSAIAPIAWGERLRALLADPLPGVRATAIESSTPWLGQAEVRAAVLKVAGTGEPRERELALLALAAAGGEDAVELARRAAGAAEKKMRVRAAEAAGELGLDDLLQTLAADAEPAVRVAAVSALLEGAPAVETDGGAARREIARRYLVDPDPAVRTTVLDALAEQPLVDRAELERAFHATDADRINDARLAAVRALAARGADAATKPEEKATIAELLQGLDGERDYLVRREAAAGLVALGAATEPGAVGPVATSKTGPAYTLVLEQTARPRFVEMDTERGKLVARLDCPEAPLTCLSFLQLAAQGYFDGTTFHRVVPDFVVQGGDPRGDGWGGPGYAIRDEMNRLRYDRGALGMALSGPDTGGSQFFFTLTPQPHLDGGYTVFGHLVSGYEILDQIRQGDLLRKVTEVQHHE